MAGAVAQRQGLLGYVAGAADPFAAALSFTEQEKSEATGRAYHSDCQIFGAWCFACGLEALTRLAPKFGDALMLGKASGHRDYRSLWVYFQPDPSELAKKPDDCAVVRSAGMTTWLASRSANRMESNWYPGCRRRPPDVL